MGEESFSIPSISAALLTWKRLKKKPKWMKKSRKTELVADYD